MGSSDLLHFVWRKVKKNKNSKMRPWTNKRKENDKQKLLNLDRKET
jgi:hypothetical protein